MKINKEYNFENFKLNKGNKKAYCLSKDVAREPGKKFTSIFISGNKEERTHLLNAIANSIMEEFNYNICYLIMDNINEIKTNADVLIIDEFENIKEENKLIEIINSFIENKKQVVLGSNKILDDINISEELKDIILWGMVVNIEDDNDNINNEKLKDYDWLKENEE